MNVETAELIKAIMTDAIKILGPAAIAAYATYRASKAQFEIKLKEIDKNHAFEARKNLFQYYKDRQVQFADDFKKLNSSLGETLGFVTGYTEGSGEGNSTLINQMADLVELYFKMIPTEIELTLRDMEKNGLKDTEEYEKLMSYKLPTNNLPTNANIETLKRVYSY